MKKGCCRRNAMRRIPERFPGGERSANRTNTQNRFTIFAKPWSTNLFGSSRSNWYVKTANICHAMPQPSHKRKWCYQSRHVNLNDPRHYARRKYTYLQDVKKQLQVNHTYSSCSGVPNNIEARSTCVVRSESVRIRPEMKAQNFSAWTFLDTG